MKTIGLILIAVAFLMGALVCVVDLHEVNWWYYAAAMAVGTVGALGARLGHRRTAFAGDKLAANSMQVISSLERIVASAAMLNGQKHTINTYDMRGRIDELFVDDLLGFVNARTSMAAAHGLAVYADVMSHFAAGERYLNRVWSASADGYVDEVNAFLERSHSEFAAALQVLQNACTRGNLNEPAQSSAPGA